jgi:hypothetical protein
VDSRRVQERPDATDKFGVQYIKGSSCTFEYEDAVMEYAEIYNRLLLRRLKASGNVSRECSAPVATAKSAASHPVTSDPLAPSP